MSHDQLGDTCYIDTLGNICKTADELEWLEDSRYYDEEQEAWETCSRYCVGTDSNGDSLTVWLNDQFVEVEDV